MNATTRTDPRPTPNGRFNTWVSELDGHAGTVRRVAGTLLVLVPLAFTVCFLLLGQLFEYPNILRQPTADVLAKFVAGGAPLVAVWYALTLTAVAFVPVTLLVHRVLAGREAPVLLWVATVFGGLVENLYVFYEHYVVDHSAYAVAFGDDATPLREAIRQTVAWARRTGDRATGAVPVAPATARA